MPSPKERSPRSHSERLTSHSEQEVHPSTLNPQQHVPQSSRSGFTVALHFFFSSHGTAGRALKNNADRSSDALRRLTDPLYMCGEANCDLLALPGPSSSFGSCCSVVPGSSSRSPVQAPFTTISVDMVSISGFEVESVKTQQCHLCTSIVERRAVGDWMQ